jgi:DNA-binding beta-propeller fold protein YncE
MNEMNWPGDTSPAVPASDLQRRRPAWLTPLMAGAAAAAMIAGAAPASGAAQTPRAGHAPSPALPFTAYVANEGANTLTPVNTATGTAGKPIRTGTNPEAVVITPNGKTAYVMTGNTVTPVDTATNMALPPIKTCQRIKICDPQALAITPNGKTAYVVDYSGMVTPIDTATNTALDPIKIPAAAIDIAITPNGKTAYVTDGTGTVTPINTATNTAGPAIKGRDRRG